MCKRTNSNTEYGGGGGGGGGGRGGGDTHRGATGKRKKGRKIMGETPTPVALEDIKQDMTAAAEKTKTLSGDLLVALVTSTW